MRIAEHPTLEELSGWAYNETDDRPVVTDTDVDDDVMSAAELDYEQEYWEHVRDDERCLPGCPHFGRCNYWHV